MKFTHFGRCRRSDGCDAHAADFARVFIDAVKHLEERLDSIWRCKNQPVVSVSMRDGLAELSDIFWRLDADCRYFKNIRPERAQARSESTRLLTCACHDDAFS